MTDLKDQLVKLGAAYPELRKHIRPLLATTKMSSRGPIAEVLDKHWNRVHDIEYALESTIHEYDRAASYVDGPARRDALNMIKSVKHVLGLLKNLSSRELDKLHTAEQNFVRKYGELDDYVHAQQDRMFSSSKGPIWIDDIRDMEKLTGPLKFESEGAENIYFTDGYGQRYFMKEPSDRDRRRLMRYIR